MQEYVFPIFTEHLQQLRRIDPGLSHKPHVRHGLFHGNLSFLDPVSSRSRSAGKNEIFLNGA
jgi:hypothetical protein